MTGCLTAFVAIGVTAVGVGAAALAYECDEPVSVSVWDPAQAHVVCDAVVTAVSGDDVVEFSPCYATTLGEGTWTVTAARPGYPPAVGTIIVPHEHRCSEPAYHTLELTLFGGRPMTNAPPPAASLPPPTTPTAPPPPEAAPVGSVPQVPAQATPAPAPAPSAR